MAVLVKTPVTILQELTVKKNWGPPKYDLVHEVVGTNNPEFQYELEIEHVIARGLGKSKKEAKHDCARNMLQLLEEEDMYKPNPKQELMKLPATPTKRFKYEEDQPTSAVSCASNNGGINDGGCLTEEFVDYCGKLADACALYRVGDPEYAMLKEMGPSHAREFTTQCKLASHKTVAMASKKRLAKQIAAERMYDQLVFDKVVPEGEVHQHLGLTITEMPKGLLIHGEEKDMDKQQMLALFQPPRTEERLESAFNELGLKYEWAPFIENPDTGTYVFLYSVKACVSLCGMGNGSSIDEAKKNAVNLIYDAIQSYLE